MTQQQCKRYLLLKKHSSC